MGALFLTTILSCHQVAIIANRLVNISLLTSQQKNEILIELRKTVPSCPLIIKANDSKRNSGN
jgi:hypothetical protein